MLKLSVAVVAVALIAAAIPQPARATKTCAFAMPAEMIDKVDSKSARPGGTFRFRITQASTSDGGVPIPAGTIGYGVIRSADPAGRRAHDGSLSLEPRYLAVPKAKGGYVRIDVTMNPTLPAVWTPTEPLLQKAAGKVPLPVPGLAMTAINTVRWGRNVTLGPGFTFSVLPFATLQKGPIC